MIVIRGFVCSLCFTAACAAAQHVEIVGFDRDGNLSWSNESSNGYVSIEWTIDPDWQWVPFDANADWNMQVTSGVQSTKLNLNVLDGITEYPKFKNRLNSHFFKAVSSEDPIPAPQISNTVTVANRCSENISNLCVQTVWDFDPTTVTNCSALETDSQCGPLKLEIPFAHFWRSISPMGDGYCSYGWALSYQHDSKDHAYNLPIVEVGPRIKEILVTISNTSCTISYPWIGWTFKDGY